MIHIRIGQLPDSLLDSFLTDARSIGLRVGRSSYAPDGERTVLSITDDRDSAIESADMAAEVLREVGGTVYAYSLPEECKGCPGAAQVV